MPLLEEKHGEASPILVSELAEVEARFAAELTSDLSCVNVLSDHLEQYRGKMLRPMLVLLSGSAAAPASALTDEHLTLATVVEMVHMATLVHDDVLDEQNVRRRAPTVNALHGNETAVMLGDYLISHAYHLCSSTGSQAVARLIARTTNTVCEGELLQLANRENWSLSEETYFQIIHRKTASLCGAGCRVGAMLAGAEERTCHAFARYGERIGAAFQIIDDVLDLTGDPEVVGKSLGKDLEKGKLTLPLIHYLGSATPDERRRMLGRLREPGPQSGRDVATSVSASHSVAYARRRAEQRVGEAKADLSDLPDSHARRMLLSMADAVLTRQL